MSDSCTEMKNAVPTHEETVGQYKVKQKNGPAHSEQSYTTSGDYTAVEYIRCCDRGKHRAMGAQRRGNHMDVGEGTQGEGVKITS